MVKILSFVPDSFVRGQSKQALIGGEGLDLAGLVAGFVDSKGNVVENKDPNNPVLIVDQPDPDFVTSETFPIEVDAFAALNPGVYKVFIKLEADTISKGKCTGPGDTCAIFNADITFT